MTESQTDPAQKITIVKNGPYRVQGKVPFIKLTQVCSEYGEPNGNFSEIKPRMATLTSCAAAASLPLILSAMAPTNRASMAAKLPALIALPCGFSLIKDQD